jgi:hypothetical protein
MEQDNLFLIIAKARNQIDDIDHEDETKDAEILNPKVVCIIISRLHLCEATL